MQHAAFNLSPDIDQTREFDQRQDSEILCGITLFLTIVFELNCIYHMPCVNSLCDPLVTHVGEGKVVVAERGELEDKNRCF